MCVVQDMLVVAACYLTFDCQNTSSRAADDELGAKPVYGSSAEVNILPPAPDNLRYAFIIFRHGIRSPIYFPFQTKEDFEIMWPNGLGELTTNGKRLMYNVGRSLRTRYNKLLPRYRKDVVTVTSSESSRATMSASYVAAGVFHPDTQPVFHREGSSTWRRVPIWDTAIFDKHKLFSEKKERSHCPKFTAMREQVKSEEKSRATPMRREFYRIINNMILTAYNQSDFINSFMDNSKAYDTFQAWILDDQDVPRWITHIFPVLEKMKQLRMWNHIYSKPKMMQFLIGTLFNQMFNEMEEASRSKSLKVHFHGSHDIPVCGMVWGIGHNETYLALPGDTVVVEMTADGLVKVKDFVTDVYLYVPLKVERSERFQTVSLRSLCGKADCSLVEFKNALTDLSFDEERWRQICNDKSDVDAEYRPMPQDINREDLQIMNEAMTYLKEKIQ